MTNVFGFIAGLSGLCGFVMVLIDAYQRADARRAPLLTRLAKTRKGRALMFAPVASFLLFFALTLISAALGGQ